MLLNASKGIYSEKEGGGVYGNKIISVNWKLVVELEFQQKRSSKSCADVQGMKMETKAIMFRFLFSNEVFLKTFPL